MKRTLCCLLLLLLLCSGFAGCRKGSTPPAASGETGAETETQPVPDTGYRKVECRQPSLMRTCYFGRFYSESVLSVSLPAEWQTVRVSDGEEYRILRDGTQVGRIYETDKEPEHTGNCLEHAQEQNYSGIVTETCILRDGTYGDCGYMRRVRLAYAGKSGTRYLVFEVDYSELPPFSLHRLTNAESEQLVTDPGMQLLSDFGSQRRTSVLILGNSFIGTSMVGYTLQAMCDAGGKKVDIEAVSIGYATVQRYTENYPEYIRRISNGEFGAVLMCGFYSSVDVDALGAVRDACRKSGTVLAAFPAHNESESVVSSACRKWDVICLDWKGEIDALIRYQKISRSEFCINDQHGHSKPLAGYVGAHMAYRALFGEIPPAIQDGGISTATARQTLGDYLQTGSIRRIPDDAVCWFGFFYPTDGK